MKKISLFFILGFVFILSGCMRSVKTESEMIDLIREEIPLSDAETVQMQSAGRIDMDDQTLLIIKTGGEYNKHSYFPAVFDKKGSSYTLDHISKNGMDNCSLYRWKNGYVIFTDNEYCADIRIRYESGEEKNLDINSIPFIYYDEYQTDSNDDGEITVHYEFLDENGSIIK